MAVGQPQWECRGVRRGWTEGRQRRYRGRVAIASSVQSALGHRLTDEPWIHCTRPHLELGLDLRLDYIDAAADGLESVDLLVGNVVERGVLGRQNGVFLEQLTGRIDNVVGTPKDSLGVEGALGGDKMGDEGLEGHGTILVW